MIDYYIEDKAGTMQTVEFGKTRVILISDRHGQGYSDPEWGGEFACVGTVVVRSRDDNEPLRVDWDNGRYNIYRSKDLQIHSGEKVKLNPNFTFKRAKKTATPNLDKKINEIKGKYEKAMKALGDTENESVMTKKERKEALDLINNTNGTKEAANKMDKKTNNFNDYMSKSSTSPVDEDDAIEKYDDDGFFDGY